MKRWGDVTGIFDGCWMCQAPLPLHAFIKVKKQNKTKKLPEWLFKRQQTGAALNCWPFIWSYNHDTVLQSKLPGPEAVRLSSLSWVPQGCPGWSLCFHNLMDWGFRMGQGKSLLKSARASVIYGHCTWRRALCATLLPIWSHPVTPAQTWRRKSASLPTLTSDPLLSSQSQSLPLLHRAQMSLPAFRHFRQSTNTCHSQTGCISPWQPSFLL